MSWLRRNVGARDISTVDDYLEALNGFYYGGLFYGGGVQQTLAGGPAERVGGDFVGLAQTAHRANGVVFACMMVRQLVFSSVRFRWQRLRDGAASAMFGTPDLRLLEVPWVGGTTQDMLSRAIQDADLAGNAYLTTDTPLPRLGGDGGREVVRLRPDWLDIAVIPRRMSGGQVGWRRAGYLYREGGAESGNDPALFLASEVAHFAPLPDPLANFRGMSWLTPVVREIQADALMTRHKRRFFENGATPNMIIKHALTANPDAIRRFARELAEEHGGVDNAYRQMHLYPGADVTVVGKDFQQIDFKAVQGAGETRICMAAGVPTVVVGSSEGQQGSALNAGNYGQARRRFADGTAHPLWQNLAGSLAPLLPAQESSVRLWYDATDVPFLREDEHDAAEIAEIRARTIRTYVDGGYTPESAVAAVDANDPRLLVHTGLYSVQLQAPGTQSLGGGDGSPDDDEAA